MNFSDDNYFMKIALEEAKIAFDESEIPIGAVLTIENKIIAKFHNQTEKLIDSTAHAEILCLTAAFGHLGVKYLPNATLYVTLEPCIMCAGALFWAQIGKLVYGANDSKRGYTTVNNNILHPKTEVISGIYKEESKLLLKEFFKNLRK